MRPSERALAARIHNLRYGFLVVPGLVSLAIAVAAPLLVWADRTGGAQGLAVGFHADPQAARTVLATVAGSLVTVAGLTFSITIVTLQLVSQQFTPRALRTFLGDRVTQVVIGAFLGTFVYCLLVLRTVRNGAVGAAFVPATSVAVAIVLGVASLALLLVFIDHMSRAIQASTIAASIAAAAHESLEPLYAHMFGEPADGDADELVEGWRAGDSPTVVYPPRAGYVQAIALERLPGKVPQGLRMNVAIAPGDFVTERTPVIEIFGDAEYAPTVVRAVVVANERDLAQDPGFGLRQLVDIAVKALSPGVNDPTTAYTCIGYLRSLAERRAALRDPSSIRRYPAHDAVVVARPHPFTSTVEEALAEVGRHAARDPRVARAVVDATLAAAEAARSSGLPARAARLDALAHRVVAAALREGPDDADAASLEERVEEPR